MCKRPVWAALSLFLSLHYVYLCRQQLRHSHAHSVEHRVGKAYMFVAVLMKCVKRSVLSRISYFITV